MTSFDGKASLC